MTWFSLIGIVIPALGLWRLSKDSRANREFWIRAFFSGLSFLLYTFAGSLFTLLLWESESPRWHILLLAGFLFSWLLYGFVWLTRAGPNFREPPNWVARRGTWLDVVLVGLTASFAIGAAVV
jgi:hypothetical protein